MFVQDEEKGEGEIEQYKDGEEGLEDSTGKEF